MAMGDPLHLSGVEKGDGARAAAQYQPPADPASSASSSAPRPRVGTPYHSLPLSPSSPTHENASRLFFPPKRLFRPGCPRSPLLTFHQPSSALQSFLTFSSGNRTLAFSPCSMASPRLSNNTRLVVPLPPPPRVSFLPRSFAFLRRALQAASNFIEKKFNRGPTPPTIVRYFFPSFRETSHVYPRATRSRAFNRSLSLSLTASARPVREKVFFRAAATTGRAFEPPLFASNLNLD